MRPARHMIKKIYEIWILGLSILSIGLFLHSHGAVAQEAVKEKEADKPTVLAVQNCLAHLQGMIDHPAAEGADLKCEIPVDVDEAELDTILTQAFDIKKLNKYKDGFASFSTKMTKSLINAQSAHCIMRVSMARDKVLEVILNKDSDVTFAAQPLSCQVKTKSGKQETVSFSFKPNFKTADRCVTGFKPQMGEIKAPCKLCRLFVTTKLVGLWVNHIGKNLTPVFNQLLYRKCHRK